MTKVMIKKDHIEIEGHTMFDYHGKDIVCAAISSIVITTVNGILTIDDEAIEYISKPGNVILDIKKHDEITNKLINNMKDLLRELQNQYPKNIKVEEVHYD